MDEGVLIMSGLKKEDVIRSIEEIKPIMKDKKVKHQLLKIMIV